MVNFLRNKTEHRWKKEDIDYARSCIVNLKDDSGREIGLLTASSEIERLSREIGRGSVYDNDQLRLKQAFINSGCVKTDTNQSSASSSSSRDIDDFLPYDFIIIEAPWGQNESFIQAMFAANSILGCARPGGVDSYKRLFDLIDRHNGQNGSNRVKMDIMVASQVDMTSTGEIKSKTIKPLVEDMKADAARRDFKLVLIPRTDAIIESMLQGELINDRPETSALKRARKTLSTSFKPHAAILGFQQVAQILADKQQGIIERANRR